MPNRDWLQLTPRLGMDSSLGLEAPAQFSAQVSSQLWRGDAFQPPRGSNKPARACRRSHDSVPRLG